MHIGLAPEPRDLALGVVAMCLLRRRQRRLPIYLAAQKLHRLLVPERRERTGLFAIFCKQPLRFADESFVKHLHSPLIDARIKNLTFRIESETQDAKTTERFASLLPKFGHSLARSRARSLARGQAHFDRPDHLGNVVGVNALGGQSVEPAQDAMQVVGTALRRVCA